MIQITLTQHRSPPSLRRATIRFMLKEPTAVALMFLDLVTTVALVSMDSTGDVEGLGGLIVEINQPQLEEVSIADG